MTSTTPAYRIEISATGGSYTPAGWNAKHSGRPTAANLARYVEGLEESTREGGVNAHLGATVVWSAKIIRQATGDTVATYNGPLFAAI